MPQYPDTSKTLIDKIRNGDEISWNEFYAQYEIIIRSIGEVANLNKSDCDCLVQNVMTKFFCYSKTFNYSPNVAKFRTYFHSIVRSQVADIIKKNSIYKNEIVLDEDVEDPIYEKIDNEFMAKFKEAVFADALKCLAQQVESKTYLSFSMTSIEKIPVKEVAKFLQLSKDNIYVNRNRCIAKLKQIVAEYNQDDPQLKLKEDFDV